MKEQILQLSAYNNWANRLLLELIKTLPPEKQVQEVPSSFPGLYKTVLHMLDAESIWWQRIKLQEHVKRPSETFTGNMPELANQLMMQDRLWLEWIRGAGEHMFLHEFKYQNSKRESFKQPVHQMLLHLFNHNTYHRGQLVTILRQLGIDKIPQTDFIVWSRMRKATSY
jgi:uncharacterized damage-inducible protein DinB